MTVVTTDETSWMLERFVLGVDRATFTGAEMDEDITVEPLKRGRPRIDNQLRMDSVAYRSGWNSCNERMREFIWTQAQNEGGLTPFLMRTLDRLSRMRFAEVKK